MYHVTPATEIALLRGKIPYYFLGLAAKSRELWLLLEQYQHALPDMAVELHEHLGVEAN